MTIRLKPEQERAVREAIESGVVSSVDEFIEIAIAGLSRHPAPPDANARREAIRRMAEFGDRQRISIGEPVTRAFIHEGHRY